MPNSETIVIRDIEELSEIRQLEQLQKRIWGVSDLDVLPALALIPLKEVGAILIGAFDKNELIGFVFGFPGLNDGRLIIHSDMLGVLPEYRSYSLGLLLKLAQRERAVAMGVDTITWTFDPLRTVNANLNFSRLGVTANRYEVNYYGETSSFLHQSGTDRLWVNWALNSKRVRERVASKSNHLDSRFIQDSTVLVRCADDGRPLITKEPLGEASLIEIPANLAELIKEDASLAAEWRSATRQAFTEALKAGYFVEDFRFDPPTQKGVYLLSRQ